MVSLSATMQHAEQQHACQAAATTTFLNHMEQTIPRLQSALHHLQQQHQALSFSSTQLAQGNLAQLNSEALAPAELVLTLDLDFSEAGEEGSAKRAALTRDVTDDLSRAAGVSAANFRVKKVSAGSVILDIDIAAGASMASPPPDAIASLLRAQAADPSSILRRGKLTCHTREIHVMSKDPGLRAEERGAMVAMAAQMHELEEALAEVQSTVEEAQVQLHAANASTAAEQVFVAYIRGCFRACIHTCKYACLE